MDDSNNIEEFSENSGIIPETDPEEGPVPCSLDILEENTENSERSNKPDDGDVETPAVRAESELLEENESENRERGSKPDFQMSAIQADSEDLFEERHNDNSEKPDFQMSEIPVDSELLEDRSGQSLDIPVDSEEVMEEEESENIEANNSNAIEVNEDGENEEPSDVEDITEEDSLLNQLPLSRIKRIMKADKENKLLKTNQEAVFLITVATELFIANITQQTAKITNATKKKTMTLAHLKSSLSGSEVFDFLEGCYPEIY